jgi:hypothetical protein
MLKTWPGGETLSMEAPPSKEVKLIAMGYNYNSSKGPCFVTVKNSGSTTLGDPYRADHDILISWHADRPELISKYFQWSNEIDKHSQAQQFQLRLEKHWRMQNAWFHLALQ